MSVSRWSASLFWRLAATLLSSTRLTGRWLPAAWLPAILPLRHLSQGYNHSAAINAGDLAKNAGCAFSIIG